MLRLIYGPSEFVRERLEALTNHQRRTISARQRSFLDQLYQAVNPTLWGEHWPVVITDVSETLIQLPAFWEILRQSQALELIIVSDQEPTWLIKQFRLLKLKIEVEPVGLPGHKHNQASFGRWVVNLFRRYGVRVNPAVIAALAEAFSESPGALVNEVRKLAAYRTNATISNRELQELIRWPNESRLFSLLNLLERKELPRFFIALKRETMLGRRTDEEFSHLFGSIQKTIAAMLLLQTASTTKELETIEMHPYRKRLLTQAAKRFSSIELIQLYNTLAGLERRLKQSGTASGVVELPKFKQTEFAEEFLLASSAIL